MYINGNACLERREHPKFDLGDLHIPLEFAGLGDRTETIEGKLRLWNDTSLHHT
jgi:hypothetical protein